MGRFLSLIPLFLWLLSSGILRLDPHLRCTPPFAAHQTAALQSLADSLAIRLPECPPIPRSPSSPPSPPTAAMTESTSTTFPFFLHFAHNDEGP
ncbi:uncharacterized protein LTHEOB_6404 [Lasiodiplodia theobromae]|uniref:uncharacterized protein n=1 Tax=Lasiodiplodia theobromae TaxID=45133 RepID=UPI0015C2EEC8|nr:uncharacterized protein LTHEOB_6404 [Lasiodiplodia theobromae]KAF4544286.1 hypothetical protein LTHEOB_6404 [Lasiodiplodia theobromae]